MRDQTTLAALQELGLTLFQARIYLSLLTKPAANGHQVAKQAGVPSAKVYENLERLAAQGLVAQLEDGRYVPLELEEFLEGKRSRLKEMSTLLREAVRSRQQDPFGELLWHGSGYQALLDKAKRLIADANEEALVSAWPGEAERLIPPIETALAAGVRVAVLTFTTPTEAGELFGELLGNELLSVHGHALLPAVHERHQNHAAFVVDERASLLMSAESGQNWAGVQTSNQAVVQTVANFIRHDIYINKLYAQNREFLEAKYGADLSGLLDPHEGGVNASRSPGPQGQVGHAAEGSIK